MESAAFVVIVPGELPDKTFDATLVLATRYRPWPVWLGVTAAFGIQCAVATAAGRLLTLLPERPVRLAARGPVRGRGLSPIPQRAPGRRRGGGRGEAVHRTDHRLSDRLASVLGQLPGALRGRMGGSVTAVDGESRRVGSTRDSSLLRLVGGIGPGGRSGGHARAGTAAEDPATSRAIRRGNGVCGARCAHVCGRACVTRTALTIMSVWTRIVRTVSMAGDPGTGPAR